jgi:hypothetical protein
MSGTTPHGLPYPSATDPLAQGAAAIQALAETIEKRGFIQAGSTVTTTGGDGYQFIPFPVPYASKPVVLVSEGDNNNVYFLLDSVSSTAAAFRFLAVGLVSNAPAGSVTCRVNWIAVGDVTAAAVTPAVADE